MKPDPAWVYGNYQMDTCTDICDFSGKPFKFEYLTKKKPTNGVYIYVIRELEPRRVYLENKKIFNCKNKKERILNHNCLALNRRVICAGDITFIPNSRGVFISNASGHYLPNIECLNYLQHLLDDLGYQVLDYYEF